MPAELERRSSGIRHHINDDMCVLDCMPIFWDGVCHVFYLHSIKAGERWRTDCAHASTRDLVTWNEHPVAFTRGGPGEMDHVGIYTGCMIEHNGVFHAIYTGSMPGHENGGENILRATSRDLTHWEKETGSIVIRPDGEHYSDKPLRDWRDPFVFWNKAESCFWMIMTTSSPNPFNPFLRAQIGLAVSDDLRNWKLQQPLYAPQTYLGMECPDMFELNGRWYLLFSVGGDMSTAGTSAVEYRMADSPRGPWRRPSNPRLDDGDMFYYAAKTLWDGKRRLIFGWGGDTTGGKDTDRPQWGGTMVTPRELVTNGNGELVVKCPTEIVNAYDTIIYDHASASSGTVVCGEWRLKTDAVVGSNIEGLAAMLFERTQTGRCLVDVHMTPATNTTQFGFYLHAQPQINQHYAVMLDAARQEICVRRSIGMVFHGKQMPALPHVLGRAHLDIAPGRPVRIVALLNDGLLEVFCDDQCVITTRILELSSGSFGFFVANGEAAFSHVSVRSLGSHWQ